MGKIKISKDALWKAAIEDLVDDFLHFFFKPYINQIDLSHPVEFLDKELDQIYPSSTNPARRGDRLLKARLKSKDYCFFLIHIEVQGYDDPEFAKRMFQSYYRLREKFEYPITALVIYTNPTPKHHYTTHEEGFMGTELNYKFPTFILKDYSVVELSQIHNPFGIVLETARYQLERGKWTDEDLITIKLKLIKRLYARGYKREKVEKLLNFITYYAPFERKENFLKFEELILKSYKPMGIKETILDQARLQGLEEGLEKGREEGLEKGREEGLEKGVERGEILGDEKRTRIAVKRMHNKGISLSEIADFLGISIEKVQTIIDEPS